MQSYLSCQLFRLFNYLVKMNSECNGTGGLERRYQPSYRTVPAVDLPPILGVPLWAAAFQESWVGVCGPLPKTLTIFLTKIYDFCYAIYDLARNSILCLSTSFPGPILALGTRLSVYDHCCRHSCLLRQN